MNRKIKAAIIAIVLILIMATILVGCGIDRNAENKYTRAIIRTQEGFIDSGINGYEYWPNYLYVEIELEDGRKIKTGWENVVLMTEIDKTNK